MESSHVDTCSWSSPGQLGGKCMHCACAISLQMITWYPIACKASWLASRTPMWRQAVKQLSQVSQPALPGQPASCEQPLTLNHTHFQGVQVNVTKNPWVCRWHTLQSGMWSRREWIINNNSNIKFLEWLTSVCERCHSDDWFKNRLENYWGL